MASRSSPWRNIIRQLPKALALALLMSALFLVALLLAATGRPRVKNQMLATFRRWHLLPAKTEEERLNYAVDMVNLAYLTQGFGIKGIIWHAIWRSTGGRFVDHFLKDELAELTGSFVGTFPLAAARRDDLGLVVSLTSLLDKYLGAIIICRFLVSISKRDYDRVFSGYGPLASFSSKIAMGKALGLLFGDMAHDLAILKKIRNDFAHGVEKQNLSAEPHSTHCRSLRMSTDLSEETIEACGTEERRLFLASASALTLYMTVVLQRAIVERDFVQQHSDEISAKTKIEMNKVREKAAEKAASA